jgi:opacity protein-like surface antigen
VWKQVVVLSGVAAILAVARPVNAQVLVQGIGGITKTAGQDPFWAGAIGGKVGPVEIDGEFGRMTNIVPKTIFDSTKAASGGLVEAELPATYGMGNVRFIAKRGAIQPFVQGGAGFARLHPQFSASDPSVSVLSQFDTSGDTTKFLAGAGAGVRVKVQKLLVDGGYRFVRVFQTYRSDTNLSNDDVLVNVHMFYVSIGFHF